jgi:hypothetical protein
LEKRSIFCIRSDGLYLERFSTYVESIKKEHQVEVLKDLRSIASLAEAGPAVLLVTVRSPAEAQELTQVLASAQVARTKGSLLVVAVQSGLNDKLEKALVKAGCKEVLPDRTDLRGLYSKIARHLKIAEQNFAKAGETPQSKVFTGSKSRFAESTSVELVTFIEPLMLNRDYWIVSNKRPAQRNMGRWIITAIGPAPSVGTWATDPNNPRIFIYKVHPSTKHLFNAEDGHWAFHGSKPEFSFELGRWSFVGTDPKLEWVGSNGAVVGVKFWHNAEAKKLVMAANSEETMRWLPKIEATFERDYRFRDDGITHQESDRADDAREMELKLGNLVKDIPEATVRFLKEAKTQFRPKAEMFAKLNDNKQISRFFEVAGNYQDRGILWLPGRIFLSDLRVHDVSTEAGIAQVIMVPPVLDPLAMIDEGMANSEDKRVFVNIKLLETSLFFYADREQITCSDGVLSIPIPSFAYEVQRRGGVRLANTPKIKGLGVTRVPPTAVGEWRIIDISPGGVGLEMASDSFSFAKDRPFKIEITMAEEVLPLICMPRWFKTDDQKGKLRVGAQFEHLSESAQEFLELYIMEKHLERIKQSSKQ